MEIRQHPGGDRRNRVAAAAVILLNSGKSLLRRRRVVCGTYRGVVVMYSRKWGLFSVQRFRRICGDDERVDAAAGLRVLQVVVRPTPKRPPRYVHAPCPRV